MDNSNIARSLSRSNKKGGEVTMKLIMNSIALTTHFCVVYVETLVYAIKAISYASDSNCHDYIDLTSDPPISVS